MHGASCLNHNVTQQVYQIMAYDLIVLVLAKLVTQSRIMVLQVGCGRDRLHAIKSIIPGCLALCWLERIRVQAISDILVRDLCWPKLGDYGMFAIFRLR